VVCSRAVSPDPSGHDETNDGDTPPTRSYIDALLQGTLTENELSNLRAEILGAGIEIDADADDQRTRTHAYTAEERRSARPGPADDADDQPTRTHAYTEEERRSARPGPADAAVCAPLRPSSRQPPMIPPRRSISSDRPAQPLSSDRPPRPLSSDRPPRSAQPLSSDRPPCSAQPVSSGRVPRSVRREEPSLFELEMPPSVPRPQQRDREAPSSASAPHIEIEVPISVPTPRSHGALAIDKTYLDALGGPGGVPRLAVSPSQLTKLPLHHQAGFLLSIVDGESTVDDLIDISGLTRLDTLRILYELVQQGIIAVARR